MRFPIHRHLQTPYTRKAAGAALAAILLGPIAHADFIPLSLTSSSWNEDMVVEDGASTFTGSVTATMDNGTGLGGFTWFEQGADAASLTTGLPHSGSTFTSAASATTHFQLQQFTGNNAILLDSTVTTDTLTFSSATPLSGLSFLTSSGNGTGTINLTINFSDGTQSVTGLTFNSPDWFNNTPVAFTPGGRASNNGSNGINYQLNGSNPNLYEEDITLTGIAAAHPISSITLSYAGGTATHTAILAVSGATVQELWTGASSGIWDIGTTANWSGSSTTFGEGDTATFDDTGAHPNITIQTGGAGVHPSAVIFNNNSTTYSIAGDAIAGPGSLTLNGTGMVTLGNVNTYTGGTVVNAGTLNLLAGATLGSSNGALQVNNVNVGAATAVNVNLNSSETVGSLLGSLATASSGVNTATINLLGASTILTVNQSVNSTFAGSIAGPGGLTKSGNGTLTLAGANTYTGGTIISGGTLRSIFPGSDTQSALSPGQSIIIQPGATLSLGVDDGIGYYGASPSSITVNGGTIASDYAVHSTLPALTLNSATISAPGAGDVGPQGATMNYILDGSVTTVASSTATKITAPKVVLRGGQTGSTVTFNVPRGTATTDLSITSSLGDQGNGLIKAGNGIMSLSGNSTYQGGTTISAGTLAVSGIQGSGLATQPLGTGTVTLNGGTLALQGQTAAVQGLAANFYDQPGGVNQANFNNLPAFQSHFSIQTPTVGPVNTTTGGKTNLDYGNGAGGNASPFSANPPGGDSANYGYTTTANYEATFTGYISIPAAGTYTFTTQSDDGSVVFIDNNYNPVVANNFFQGFNAKSGTYTFASAGLYPIAIGYNQGGGGQGFYVAMSPPGGNSNIILNAQVFSAGSTYANSQIYANNVNVTANSTIDVSNSPAAFLGNLSIGQNTLNLTGTSGTSVSVNSMNLTGNATLNTAAGTTFKSGPVSDDFNTSVTARSLTKNGNGSLILNSAGTYSGGTIINAGTVTIGQSSALGTGAVTLNGGVLSLTSAGTAGFNNYALNGNGAPTLDPTNTILTLTDNGANEARSAFSQSQVSIANGFTASFVYTAGGNKSADGFTLAIQNNSPTALGQAGGALGYGGPNGTNTGGILNSGAVEFNLYTGNGGPVGTNVTTNGVTGNYLPTAAVNLASGDPISVAVVYDNTAKTLTETLTDQLTNGTYTNVFTGADLAALIGGTQGYIGFTGGTGGATATQTISNFLFNNYSQGVTLSNNLSVSPAATAGLDVTPVSTGGAGTATLQGGLSLGAGSTLKITGGASATNTPYSLNVLGDTTLAGNATIAVFNNGTGAGIATFSTIDQTSAASLTKTGNGTLALTGPATYTGATNITAGALSLSAAGSLASNAINVSSGATFDVSALGTYSVASTQTITANGSITGNLNVSGKLTGTGSVLGTVTALSGSTIAPGNGGGSLSMNDFSLNSGANFTLELGGTGAGLFDQLKVTGAVSLAGTLHLTLINGYQPHVGDQFFILLNDGADAISGTFTNGSTISVGPDTFAISYAANGDGGGIGNDIRLTVTNIPEPGNLSLLVAGLASCTLPRWRRKK